MNREDKFALIEAVLEEMEEEGIELNELTSNQYLRDTAKRIKDYYGPGYGVGNKAERTKQLLSSPKYKARGAAGLRNAVISGGGADKIAAMGRKKGGKLLLRGMRQHALKNNPPGKINMARVARKLARKGR